MIDAAEWTGAAGWGCVAGAMFFAISEALLARWRRSPEMAALQVAFVGMLVRTVWMLTALTGGMAGLDEGHGAFVAALMAAYLAAQVVEGLRYTRFAESRTFAESQG